MSLVVVLIVLPLALWIWIVAMARDMYGPMTGASAWMMTPVWDGPHLFLLWAMWAGMMAAMMLPSAAPLILIFSRQAAASVGAPRRSADGARAGSPRRSATGTKAGLFALVAGYLTMWAAFSVGATILQRLLAASLVLSPMMETTTASSGAVLLLIAGLYQWTPIKGACLRACQSPVDFLMRRWRAGRAGAFRMGLSHGAYCVGCCWALMLLLFVGGVMNLATIAALTAFVTVEKLAPFGMRGTKAAGALLVGAGIWMLLR
jgi:predicted metal-binding membrane protein